MKTNKVSKFWLQTGLIGLLAFITLCISYGVFVLDCELTFSGLGSFRKLYTEYLYAEFFSDLERVLPVLLFFMLNIVAEKNFIVLPHGNTISASFAIILASMFLFDPPIAVLLAVGGILVAGKLMNNFGWRLTTFLIVQYVLSYSLAGIAMVVYFRYMPEFFDDELYRKLIIGGAVTLLCLAINMPLTNTYISILNPQYKGQKRGLGKIFQFGHNKLKIFQMAFLFPIAVMIAYSYDIVPNPIIPVILAIMCIGSVRFVDQHQRIGHQIKKMMVLYRLFQKMSETIFQESQSQISPVDFFENLLSGEKISTAHLIPNHRTSVYQVESYVDTFGFSHVISYPAVEPDEMEISDQNALLNKIAKTQRGMRLNDLKKYPEIDEKWREKYQSLISYPIVVDSEVEYIIVMFRDSGRAFAKQDMRFVHLLSNSLAFTMKNMQLRDRLQQQAVRDGLLGIFNRRHLINKLEEELTRAQRYQRPLSVIIIDVDYFKQFNDTHGHILGDQLLRDITSIIEESIRYTDIPARYGGDELFIILPETDLKGAITVAEKIHKKVGEHKFTGENEQEVSMSLSLGVTESKPAAEDEPVETTAELIARADEALYEAKENGRDQVRHMEAD